MIGPRITPRIGPRIGVAVGVSEDPDDGGAGGGGGSMTGVTQDATSSKYCPATAAEWTTTLAAAGLANLPPASLWLMQEASGNLADSIDSQVLTVTASPSYQQSNPGWSRKGITMAGTTVKFVAPAGVFDASTTSVAWLGYGCPVTTPGGNRVVIVLSDNVSNGARIDHTSADKLLGVDVANSGATTNSYTTTAIFPILFVFDRTHATCTLYTALEAKTVTYNAAITDGNKGIGALVGSGDGSMHWTYLTVFTGAAAEQLNTAGARSLLSALGWSPAF